MTERAVCILICVVLSPLCSLCLAADIPAGRYKAATFSEKAAKPGAGLLERLQGEVGSLELEYVEDNALIRSAGQILWLERQDEDTMTFSASWTEGAQIFTRSIIITKKAEDGIRFGGTIDAWSTGRRVERALMIVADQP